MLHQTERSKGSKSNAWWTPLETFEMLCKLYKFKPNLDTAASKRSTLCDNFLDRKTDALKVSWKLHGRKSRAFLNPPNNKEKRGKKTRALLSLFIQKAYLEFAAGHAKIMMIVPLNTQSSVKSWWPFVQAPMERGEDILVRPIKSRIAFQKNGVKNTDSSINGYCVVLFGFNRKKVMKRLKIKC